MIEDIFSFDDFLSKNGKRKPSSNSLREKFEEEDRLESEKIIKKSLPIVAEEEEELIEEPSVIEEPVRPLLGGPESSHTVHDRMVPNHMRNMKNQVEQEEEEEEEEEEESYDLTNESAFVTTEDEDDFYKLYQDKNEEFVCDIMIEGSSPEETYARIIVESENWSLVFPGEIRNGKCVVPIKKLNILKEGEVGNIKLEVVAEGNLFIPWENQFKVKMSKKVTVMMNENKKQQPKKPIINNKIGVKVNVK
jgi:hypothetical protein